MDLPAKAATCKCDACQDGNCSLEVSGLGRQIDILNLDCIKSAYRLKGHISDFGIVWKNKNTVAVVELKGGRKRLSIEHLVEQIQGGLDALDGLLAGQAVGPLYPLLIFQGKNDPTASLSGKRVTFRGTPRRVIARRCGTRLSAILKQVPR